MSNESKVTPANIVKALTEIMAAQENYEEAKHHYLLSQETPLAYSSENRTIRQQDHDAAWRRLVDANSAARAILRSFLHESPIPPRATRLPGGPDEPDALHSPERPPVPPGDL